MDSSEHQAENMETHPQGKNDQLSSDSDPTRHTNSSTEICPLCMEKSPVGSDLCQYCMFPLKKDLREQLAKSKRAKLFPRTDPDRMPLRLDFWLYGLLAILCPLLMVLSIQIQAWQSVILIFSGLVLLAALGRWLSEKSRGLDLRSKGYRISFVIGFGLLIVGSIAAQ